MLWCRVRACSRFCAGSLQPARSHEALAGHLVFSAALRDASALFRHDVAYCLGQRQDLANIEVLAQTLGNVSEHPMYVAELAFTISAVPCPSSTRMWRGHPAHI